jgi:hypothetical protein
VTADRGREYLFLKGILELWLILTTPKLASCWTLEEGDVVSHEGLLFLGRDMLRKYLHTVLLFEISDESWIP